MSHLIGRITATMALVFLAVSPAAAHAVQKGEGDASIVAFCDAESDSDQDTDMLVFAESAQTSCGTADQTTSISDGATEVTVTTNTSIDGSGPPGGEGQGGGQSQLDQDVIATGPAEWTLSGSLSVSANAGRDDIPTVATSEVRFAGETRSAICNPSSGSCNQGGGISASGTLAAGVSRTLEVDATCRAIFGSCSAQWTFVLTVRDADAATPSPEITSGPSGTTRDTSAAFTFGMADPPPPGHFECRVDSAGAGFTACTSPHTVSDLAAGDHVFEVRYNPDSGQTSAPAERRWTVEDCPEVPMVGFAQPDGCFTETEPGSGVFTTTERAFVGGFEILPRPEGSLVVDTNARTLNTAGAGADLVVEGVTIPFPISLIPVGAQDATFELGQTGTAVASIIDFPLESTVKVSWAGDGKSATYEQEVKVEDASAGIGEFVTLAPPEGVGESSGKLKAKLENGTGFALESAEIAINEVAFKPRRLRSGRTFKLKNLLLKFERRADKPFWTGQAGIGLPLTRGDLDVTGTVFVFDNSFAGFGFEVDGINKRVLGPLFLQKVGGAGALVPIASPPPGVIAAPEFGYDLRVGGTLGPRVQGVELVKFTGTIQGGSLVSGCEENVRRPDPTKFEAVAELSPLEGLEQAGLADVNMTTRSCIYPGTGSEAAAIEGVLEGKLSFANDTLGYEGKQTGFVSTVGVSYEGEVLLRLPGLPDPEGSAIVSKIGVAACTDILPGVEGGFGHQWGSGGAEFLEGCDLGGFRLLQAPRSRSGAGSAPSAVQVPKGLPHVAFAATGQTGAPPVRVSGPGGFSASSPADGSALRERDVAILRYPDEQTTYVLVDDPKPGRWQVESLDPANPVVALRLNEGLPEPKVKGKVAKPRGKSKRGKFRFDYSLRRIPGQDVIFTERGDGVAQELGKVSDAKGAIGFKPTVAAGRARTIEAEVIQDGLPRELITVARFKAPPQPKLRKPEPAAKRKNDVLTVTWDKIAGATEYSVEVSAGGELLERTVSERTKIRFDGLPEKGKLVVTAQALSDAQPPGPVAKITVKR